MKENENNSSSFLIPKKVVLFNIVSLLFLIHYYLQLFTISNPLMNSKIG